MSSGFAWALLHCGQCKCEIPVNLLINNYLGYVPCLPLKMLFSNRSKLENQLASNLKKVGLLKALANLLPFNLLSNARCLINQQPFEVSNGKCFLILSLEARDTEDAALARCHRLIRKLFVNNWTAGCESCRQGPSSSVHPQGHH